MQFWYFWLIFYRESGLDADIHPADAEGEGLVADGCISAVTQDAAEFLLAGEVQD